MVVALLAPEFIVGGVTNDSVIPEGANDDAEAQRQGMSLAAWLEALANREILARERERQLALIYPQKYRRSA